MRTDYKSIAHYHLTRFILVAIGLVVTCCSSAALIYSEGPDGAHEIITQKIRENPSFLNLRPEDDVTMTCPHLWFGVEPKDIASGHLLPTVISKKCWRYILMHGTNVVGIATVYETDRLVGKKLEFGELGKTGGAEETLKALQIAKNWPRANVRDYEIKLLSAIGLHFDAVWLHGKSDEVFIPLSSANELDIQAYHLYSKDEILKLLKPEAEKMLNRRSEFRK